MLKDKLKWITKLFLEYLIKLFILILVIFLFNQVVMTQISSNTGREYIEMKEFRFDKGYQFFNYLSKIVRFDFGKVPSNNADASFYLIPGIINSSVLLFPALIFAVLVVYRLCKSYFLKRHKFLSEIINNITSFVSLIPVYWLAFIIFLIILAAPHFLDRSNIIIIITIITMSLYIIPTLLKLKVTNIKINTILKNIITIGKKLVLFWLIFLFFVIISSGKAFTDSRLTILPIIMFVILFLFYILIKRGSLTLYTVLKYFFISLSVIVIFYVFMFNFVPDTGFKIGGTASYELYDSDFFIKLFDRIWYLIVPWIPLVTFFIIMLAKSLYNTIDTVNKADFLKMLRSKGLSNELIFTKHLKPLIISNIFSELTSYMPLFITYMVVVEYVFSYKGIGYYSVYAGYPVQNASVLFIGILVIFAQFLGKLLRSMFIPFFRKEQISPKKDRTLIKLFFTLVITAFSGMILTMIFNSFDISFTNEISFSTKTVIISLIAVFMFIWLIIEKRKKINKKKDKNIEQKSKININKVSGCQIEKSAVKISKNKKKLLVKISICVLVIFILILIGFLTPFNSNNYTRVVRNSANNYYPPTLKHPMGVLNTIDGNYQDYSVLVFLASRYIVIIIIVSFISVFIGLILGVIGGLYKTSWNNLLHKSFEFVEMLPSILLLIILYAFLQGSIYALILTLLIIGSAQIYSIVRKEVILLKQHDFVKVAEIYGLRLHIMLLRHIIPNLSSIIFPRIINLIRNFLILDATLIYIVQFYRTDSLFNSLFPVQGWGSLISSSIDLFVRGEILTAVFPGVFLIFCILLLNKAENLIIRFFKTR